ncbi:MAG: hypothetical protein RBT69_08060 [Spirochaetia bacterium]|nr:hypothetical protein [Spirochaetia bacterium]
MQRKYLTIFMFISFFSVSCASTRTSQSQYQEAAELFKQRDFASAGKVIESHKDKSYKEKDRVLFFLDIGMLYHFSGDYEKSNEALSAAEQGIDELYTKSVSKALVSGVLNDNALDYRGEDYEDIYLNIFKALNYIALDKMESALVEIRRVHIKLNILEDKYQELIEIHNSSDNPEGEIVPRKNRFHNDALARYLGLLLFRMEGKFDSARIERDEIVKAFQLQKQLYDFEKPDLPELSLDKENAHLSVIAFTGNSPRKLAETFYLQTTPDIVWIVATSQDEEYVKNVVGFNNIFMPGIKGGFHFKFQYPKMKMMGSEVDRVEIVIDGETKQSLDLIENMERISREIFLVKQPLVVGKTVIRTVTKNILKESGKKQASESLTGGNPFLDILLGVTADIAVDATENADLRISPYFPAFARVADIVLPPGIHSLSIDYYSSGQLIFRDFRGNIDLKEGELNLVESFLLK